MHAIVLAADVQDRDGGALLMASLFGAFPFLIKLYADGGYQGLEFQSAIKRILARVHVEIVKRSGQATGFIALPKRWIVERTFAWLGRCRRLAKDWDETSPYVSNAEIAVSPRADRIEQLQQRRAQQSLRRDGGTPARLVKRRKRPVELGQRRIGHSPHRSQRMFRRYPRLNVDIGKQRPSRSIFAAHLSRPRIASPTPANSCRETKLQCLSARLFQRPARAFSGLTESRGIPFGLRS